MTCRIDGCYSFDHVRLVRVRDDDGEPTDRVLLEAERDGGEPGVTVRCTELWDEMDAHMRTYHGNNLNDPLTFRELEHVTTRTAVAFLLD